MWLYPPEENIDDQACPTAVEPWLLPGYDQGRAEALLNSAHLAPEVRSRLAGTLRCESSKCSLRPDEALVSSLNAQARAVLYGELARFEVNTAQAGALRIRAEDIEPWLASLSARPGLQEKVRGLLYRTGEAFGLADLPLICAGQSAEERHATARALSRTRSVIATLIVRPGDDIEALVRYWGVGGRENRVRPLLNALARKRGGGKLDIVHLFPPFPRTRVYRYPSNTGVRYGSHASALNFFNMKQPDDKLVGKAAAEELAKNYRTLTAAERRFGDVIALRSPDGALLHSMIYVADDLVLTKDGSAPRYPWVLSSLAAMRTRHRSSDEVQEVYLRRGS